MLAGRFPMVNLLAYAPSLTVSKPVPYGHLLANAHIYIIIKTKFLT